MDKIKLHKINSDLTQAKESAEAIRMLQDEIENVISKQKDANLRYNNGEISKQEHDDITKASHDSISSLNSKIRENIHILIQSIDGVKELALEQEPEVANVKPSKKKTHKHKAPKKKKKK